MKRVFLVFGLCISIYAQEVNLKKNVRVLFEDYISKNVNKVISKRLEHGQTTTTKDFKGIVEDEIKKIEGTQREKDILLAEKTKIEFNIKSSTTYLLCMKNAYKTKNINESIDKCSLELEKFFLINGDGVIHMDKSLTHDKKRIKNIMDTMKLDVVVAKQNLTYFKNDAKLINVLKKIPKTSQYNAYEYVIYEVYRSIFANNY